MELIALKPSHALRARIGHLLASIFALVGTSLLSATMASLWDIIKSKEDAASIKPKLCGIPSCVCEFGLMKIHTKHITLSHTYSAARPLRRWASLRMS